MNELKEIEQIMFDRVNIRNAGVLKNHFNKNMTAQELLDQA
jgi:hypothetical protein